VAVISRTEQAAYLARLGLEAEPPSVDGLFRLHRAHVERVSYETLWIQIGDRWGIGVGESVARIATRRRGGYCYHLNGAFSGLLQGLGYDVVRHVGGVHGPDGPTEDAMSNHLVLTVHGLPVDANPRGSWYVDAGLGDALHEPIPLLAGEYRQGPFLLVLDETPGGIGDWHLTHDPAGSFAGMSWRSATTDMEAFADRHTWLSTSPDSGFVRVLTAQRRDASGVDILRGLLLKRIGDRAFEQTLTTRAELADVLGGLFGLDIAPISEQAWDALWANVQATHAAWESARRP
jgi:N-hydroxyarylamine O-acetyltransferase